MSNQQSSQGVLWLVVSGAVQTDAGFPLSPDAETVFGREPTCDIALEAYTNVSRRHAAIRPLETQPEQWAIYDLNSSNGTYINGERLQGTKVLQSGDRIMLAQGGPEFQFGDQSSSPSLSVPEAQAAPQFQHQTVETSKYRLEFFPSKFVIQCKNSWAMAVIGSVMALFFSMFFPPFFVMAVLVLPVLAFTVFKDVYYSFDLESGQLIVGQSTFAQSLLRRHRKQRYPLTGFTAVRLQKSNHWGDKGTKYDDYAIYLDRETETPLKLAITWRYNQRSWLLAENPQEAQQLVDWIESYLLRVNL